MWLLFNFWHGALHLAPDFQFFLQTTANRIFLFLRNEKSHVTPWAGSWEIPQFHPGPWNKMVNLHYHPKLSSLQGCAGNTATWGNEIHFYIRQWPRTRIAPNKPSGHIGDICCIKRMKLLHSSRLSECRSPASHMVGSGCLGKIPWSSK